MNIHLALGVTDVNPASPLTARIDAPRPPNPPLQGPNLVRVMSLRFNDDFLMHGVVLQNRVFRT
jgi:hypothetical protein